MFKKKMKSEKIEDNSLNLFKKISRLFIFLSIILLLWVIIVAAGSIIIDMDPYWAFLSLEDWTLFSFITILLFALIEILYYIYTYYYSDKIVEFEEIEPETLHGKKVYIYTTPKDSKGGVFSKTYIQINNESVIRIRNQIIPPEEL
jgi:hypothetical protein